MSEHPLQHLERLRREDPELEAEYLRRRPQFEAIRALIAARVKAGLSQRELARRMNVSQAVVSRLESGDHSPRIETLTRAANALEMDMQVVFKKRASRQQAADRSSRPQPAPRRIA